MYVCMYMHVLSTFFYHYFSKQYLFIYLFIAGKKICLSRLRISDYGTGSKSGLPHVSHHHRLDFIYLFIAGKKTCLSLIIPSSGFLEILEASKEDVLKAGMRETTLH